MSSRRRVTKPVQEDFQSDFSDEEEQEEAPARGGRKASKAPASRKRKASSGDTFVDKSGWTVVPPSLIWRDIGEPDPSSLIAAFSLDDTLVNRSSNSEFPRSAADWKWWNKKVPEKLAELAEEGYKIVIFSNHGNIKGALTGKQAEVVEDLVELVHKDLCRTTRESVALQVFLAPRPEPTDACRKPAKGMWDHMVEHCNGGFAPDLEASFFVGDTTYRDVDRAFAAAIGLPFHTAQEYFGDMDGKPRLDRKAVKAAAEGIKSGQHPNADLVTQLRDLASRTYKMHDEAKTSLGMVDSKLGFKARAYRIAADSLSTFPRKISGDNLREVGKLKGVGKATLERVRQYVDTGSIRTQEDEEDEALLGHRAPATPAPAAAAAAAGGAAAPQRGAARRPSEANRAAFAFM